MGYGDDWTVQVRYYDGNWEVYVSASSGYGYWRNESTAETPPSGPYSYFDGVNSSDWGTPTLSGGGLIDCPISGGTTPTPAPTPAPTPVSDPSIVAMTVVDADPSGYLDVVLPVVEGEDPVMAGLRPLAAIHTVGDTITGGSTSGPIHVYVYSVDITTTPETIVLIDHWMSSFDRMTYKHVFSWDTAGLAPGYYDVRLSFGTTAVQFRIQLTAAE